MWVLVHVQVDPGVIHLHCECKWTRGSDAELLVLMRWFPYMHLFVAAFIYCFLLLALSIIMGLSGNVACCSKSSGGMCRNTPCTHLVYFISTAITYHIILTCLYINVAEGLTCAFILTHAVSPVSQQANHLRHVELWSPVGYVPPHHPQWLAATSPPQMASIPVENTVMADSCEKPEIFEKAKLEQKPANCINFVCLW